MIHPPSVCHRFPTIILRFYWNKKKKIKVKSIIIDKASHSILNFVYACTFPRTHVHKINHGEKSRNRMRTLLEQQLVDTPHQLVPPTK